MRLPLAPATPADATDATDAADEAGCAGCSRRDVLAGLSAASLAALLAACGTEPNAVPDAPMTGTMECGPGKVCLDLGDSANAPLLEAGGFRVVETSAGRVIVVRTSATEVAALSAVCTHQGCTVRYEASATRLACPCHGARYALSGEVLRGPATRALPVYGAVLDGTRNLIEITLA